MEVGKSRRVCCVCVRAVSSNESVLTTESWTRISHAIGSLPSVEGSGAVAAALAALKVAPDVETCAGVTALAA
eukprot:6209676-Amphidinium_carterae.1